MNIALLHYTAPPVVGGVENVLAEHARLMAAAGHQVTILAGRGMQTDDQFDFTCIPALSSSDAQVLAVKEELDRGEVTQRFHDLVGVIEAELAAVLAETDVLVAHNVLSLHKNLALTAALHHLTQRADAPALVTWHHDLAWTTPRYAAELHEGYPWDLLRQEWPWALQVVVSEMRREELAELYGMPQERIAVVPNGIDPRRFFKLEEQTEEFVDRLNLLDAAPLLLLPVRITPRKNIELALHALAALRREFPRAVLVVTGPLGPHNPGNVHYFGKLARLRADLGLEGAARFLAELTDDYLPDEVIADFYRLADALLLPSREEGFGIPVLEAGLEGIPVFCADIEPLRRLGGEYAAYFSPDADPGDVAAMMAHNLSHSAVYALRTAVRERYIWESIYTGYIEPILQEAVEKRQA